MGTDKQSGRRKRLAERKAETRSPKADSFLIITEGTKTEPCYFNGLAEYVNKNHGKSIEVRKLTLDTHGEGKSTTSLVREAKRIAARAPILYNQIWILFDKDDNNDFDGAIEECNTLSYEAGWSNQSFEFWLFLHFEYSDSALHRDEWYDKLNRIFKTKGIQSPGYQKNDPKLFERVTAGGGLKKAVRNAEKIYNKYKEDMPPSRKDPCTTVHLLIKELSPWIQELL